MTSAELTSFVQSYGAVAAILAVLGLIALIGILETVRQEIKLKREVNRRRMSKFSD